MSMFLFLPVALIAGVIQSVTGFGAGVILILLLSNYYTMAVAPAINTSICLGLTVMMAWKYRTHINFRMLIVPVIAYLTMSVSVISIVEYMNMNVLAVVFGLFLMSLSVFFLVFAGRIHLRASLSAAICCAGISGVFSGLFGVGGPVMGLYLVTVSNTREEYLANIQFLFTLTNIVNISARIWRGLYTADLLPVTVIGVIAVNLGAWTGNWAFRKSNVELLKKMVYLFVGVSGLITVIQHLI